jgi:hypothetical protein
MKKSWSFLGLAVVLSLVLAACAGPAATPTTAATTAPTEVPTEVPPTEAPTEVPPTEAPTEVPPTEVPTEVPFVAPEGALVAVPVESAPELDGVGDDAAWETAPAIEIEVDSGANMGSSTVTLQSVYDGENVYFLMSYADPTESLQRTPWVMQADGTWKKLTDPEDEGGDNNLYYEDKFSFIWPINYSVPDFEDQGCATACHINDDSGKPFGNKYLEEEGQLADLWHWKSARQLNQVDDQYLDSTPWSTDTPNAGRKSDPNDGGGYVDNQTEDKTQPMWALPDNAAAPPYVILDSEKVPFDASAYEPGDEVPAVVISEFLGDRGNISAGWKYADGAWTIEFSRALTTGSEFDVQFEDLEATYFFGVAVFDNAQVRHAFQRGATPFVFRP